jgi:hypothetical protein
MRQTSLALTLTGLVTFAALAGIHACRAQDKQTATQSPAKEAKPAAAATAEDKALVAYFRQAIKSQDQDRTQEILCLLTDGSAEARAWAGIPEALAGDNKAIQALAGEIPASQKDIDQARLVLGRLKGYIETSRRVPKSQTYTLPKISASTTLADLTASGDKLPRFTPVQMNIAYPKETPNTPSPAKCEMAWSNDALFLRYTVTDPTPISKNTERDSGIYDDDCVEIFLVAKSNPAQYWELNIGRNGGIRDVFIKKSTGKWFGQVSNEATLKGLEFKIQETSKDAQPTGYTVVAKIPWSDLLGPGAKPKTGDKFPFTVGFSDSFKKSDGSQGQTYYSNIYTYVGYHDVARYDTFLLGE